MNHFSSEWNGVTTLHPLGLLSVIVAGLFLLAASRKVAYLPIIALSCFVPQAQRVVIGGADFDLLRILAIIAVARIIVRQEYRSLRFNSIDIVLVMWAFSTLIFPLIRDGAPVFVNRMGNLYDIFAMYFVARCLISGWEELSGAIKAFMVCALPTSVFFLLESVTSFNVFSVFGGVPQFTAIREGRLRCQGAFSHPILAGCFWAGCLPLILSHWRHGSRRLLVVSTGAILVIIVTCASVTPLLGLFTGIVGFAFIPIKRHLRKIVFSIPFVLFALHMVMNKPVWHLISRTASLGGSSWHRYALIDGAITHWSEWWLVGSYVGSGHWGHFTFDVTNFYIVQAITGGMVQLLLFIALIFMCYRRIGKLIRSVDPKSSYFLLAWGMGVSLTVHAVNHFGVSYFGQVWIGWYFLLGAIASSKSFAKGNVYTYLIDPEEEPVPPLSEPAGSNVCVLSM
jgi:hypothetical protein